MEDYYGYGDDGGAYYSYDVPPTPIVPAAPTIPMVLSPLDFPAASTPDPVFCTLPQKGAYILEKHTLTPLSQTSGRKIPVPRDIVDVLSGAEQILLLSPTAIWDFSSFKAKLLTKKGEECRYFAGSDGVIFQTRMLDKETEIQQWDAKQKKFVPLTLYPGEAGKVTSNQNGEVFVMDGDCIYRFERNAWKKVYENEDDIIFDILCFENRLLAIDSQAVRIIQEDARGELFYKQGGQQLLYDGNDYFIIDNRTVYLLSTNTNN